MARILLITLVGFYQRFISPFTGNRCRFHPSCSHYCVQSVTRHGFIKGVGYTLRRLLKCNPYHPGGYDPVP